jgi:hypothetical protein
MLQKKKTKVILCGPFIRYPNLCTIPKNKQLLEAKLKIDSKNFRKRQPLKASIYG